MNWRYDNPVVNGEYVCCLLGHPTPMILLWDKDNGGWRMPIKLTYKVVDRILLDDERVVCYTSLSEIPMPDNW